MNSLIYANSAIKARENTSLLSRDKLIRLLDAEATVDAVKILTESGYGGGLVIARAEDYQDLLDREEEVYLEYVKSVAPQGLGVESLFLEKDYLNLKVLVKNRVFGADARLTGGGIYDKDALVELVEKGESTVLPKDVVAVVNGLLDSQPKTPADIDVTLDRAYYRDVVARVKKSHSAILKEYFTAKIDGVNVLTYLRAKKAGLNLQKLSSLLVDGGSIAPQDLVRAYEEDGLMDLVKNYPIRTLVEDNASSIVGFEKALDDSLIALLNKDKDDMFSLAPLAYYVVAKGLELKTVSVILTGVQNNAPKSAIKERVRQIYA